MSEIEELTLIELIDWLYDNYRGVSANCFEDEIYPILREKAVDQVEPY